MIEQESLFDGDVYPMVLMVLCFGIPLVLIWLFAEASAGRVRPFPCGHKRGFGDSVNPDFDVICPICYGHFFRHTFLPYLLFVISFVTIYFWHPLGLPNMVLIVLSLFVASYVSAVLRRRPDRLILTLLVFSSVTCLVLVRPTIGSITAEPLDGLTLGPLILLAIAITIGLARGVARVIGEGIHDASPILSLVFVVSLVITVADLAAKSASTLAPSIDGHPMYASICKIIDLIQRYKLAGILIAIAIAVVWAGGVSVSTAREQVEEDPWKRKLRHKWWEEMWRLLLFFGLVLISFSVGIWKLFRDTIKHLWEAASSCARVFLLIFAAWALAAIVKELAELTSHVWENNSFWFDSWRPLWAIPSFVFLACVIAWAFILIALVGDKRNSTNSWSDELFHASLVTRFNLVRSMPIYWFYLSLVLFVSWFVISALRLAKDPTTGFQVGIAFVTYLAFLSALGTGNLIRSALRRSHVHAPNSRHSTQPPSAQPHSTQPPSAQPHSAQPHSAQSQSAQSQSAQDGTSSIIAKDGIASGKAKDKGSKQPS